MVDTVNRHIITIDGPGGAGKSTVAKLLSQKLAWAYLDSGALYRIVAYLAYKKQITDYSMLLAILEQHHIQFKTAQNRYQVFLDQEDISAAIRTEKMGKMASDLAKIPAIRQALVDMQRNYEAPMHLVTDGRDMGSAIFPEAALKLYLTASLDARALRRQKELAKSGEVLDMVTIKKQLQARDDQDQKRAFAPLVAPEGSVEIDTTPLEIDQVVEMAYKLWHNKAILVR